jgi:hypothetical protein
MFINIHNLEDNVAEKLVIAVKLLHGTGYAYYFTIKELCRHLGGHFLTLNTACLRRAHACSCSQLPGNFESFCSGLVEDYFHLQ